MAKSVPVYLKITLCNICILITLSNDNSIFWPFLNVAGLYLFLKFRKKSYHLLLSLSLSLSLSRIYIYIYIYIYICIYMCVSIRNCVELIVTVATIRKYLRAVSIGEDPGFEGPNDCLSSPTCLLLFQQPSHPLLETNEFRVFTLLLHTTEMWTGQPC